MDTLLLSNDDPRRLVRYVGPDRLMDELIDRLTEALQTFDEQKTQASA